MDNSATTPVDRRVVDAMLPFLTERFGNPSSVHFYGQEARAAVDRARREVAALINARPNEVVFLSGGTEANNLGVRGVAEMNAERGRHIITSSIEHSSVRGICDALEERGWEVTRLPAYEEGVVRVEDVRAAIRPDTVLVTLMLANNEIGTVQPVAEIGALVRELRAAGHKHLWLHTDAVQSLGRMAVDVETLGLRPALDVGAQAARAEGRRRAVRAPQRAPRGAEHRRPPGARAARRHRGRLDDRRLRRGRAPRARRTRRSASTTCGALRDRFEAGVAERVTDIVFNGDRERRLPHISNISFRFIEGEGLLINLDMQGVAVSTGSACSSGSLEPSPVIRALGRDDELARGSIRFSLGKDTTDEDISYVLEVLPRAVENLRRLSPLYQKALAERACAVV